MDETENKSTDNYTVRTLKSEARVQSLAYKCLKECELCGLSNDEVERIPEAMKDIILQNLRNSKALFILRTEYKSPYFPSESDGSRRESV